MRPPSEAELVAALIVVTERLWKERIGRRDDEREDPQLLRALQTLDAWMYASRGPAHGPTPERRQR